MNYNYLVLKLVIYGKAVVILKCFSVYGRKKIWQISITLVYDMETDF